MYEASGTIYSSPAAAQFSSQQAQVQDYSTATVIYQPPIIQPYIQPIQPQQYYVQQQMWPASFQQAQPAYFPQYTIQQQPAYQAPDQAQPVPLVNLARLVSSSSQDYSTGSATMSVAATSTSVTTTGSTSAAATRTKMVPTRLKNMGGGARTKAKMREMLEQQKRMELVKQQEAPKKKRVRKPKEKPTKEKGPSQAKRGRPKSNITSEEAELDQSINDTINSVIIAASPPTPAQSPQTPISSAQLQACQSVMVVPTQAPVPRKKGRPRKHPLPEYPEVRVVAVVKSSLMPQLASPASTSIKVEIPEGKLPKSAKKGTAKELPLAEVVPEPTPQPIVKRKRGRPSKSKEVVIKTELVEVQPLPLETPRAKAPSPKKVSPGKARSPDKSPKAAKAEVDSPKEKKVKLSPNTAAILKATASEKLKTAKVRVRAKVAKALKTVQSEEIVQAQMTTAALKLKQRAMKTPRVRGRVRKLKAVSEGEGETSKPPRKHRKLDRPTDESMNETIDYVVGLVSENETKPTQQELALVAVPSTSASARLALAEANFRASNAGAKKAKVPTVFVKKSDLTVVKRLGEKERKEHSQKGPSLKVRKDKVKFYRGGEEEEEPVVRVGQEKPRVEFDESVPWRCIFCNFKQFSFGLGDLFGPYYIERLINGQPRPKETWLHSGCSVWAPGVVLIGSTLYGLSEAVEQSEGVECTICMKRGATVACLQRFCTERAHLPCALMNKWTLNENNFKSKCPAHGERGPQSQSQSQSVESSPSEPRRPRPSKTMKKTPKVKAEALNV